MLPDLATAQSHHQAGNLQQAETSYQQILDADPHNAGAWHLLGLVHIQTGRSDSAVDHICRAIELNASVAAYHNHMGIALAKREQPEAAVESLCRAVSLDPGLRDARFNLGNVYGSLERHKEAVEQYEAAAKIDPNSAETHFNLANALRKLRRLDEAVASYQEALRIRPNYIKAHTNLGSTYRDQKRFDRAEECYRSALRIKPDYARAYHNLGSLANARRKFTEAEEHFRDALRIKPELTAARNGLGKALAEQGKLDEAIELLESASQDGEGLIEAQLNLSDKLRIEGRYDDALACAEKVLEIKSDTALAHNNAGLALAAKGDLDEAVVRYRRALQIKPDFAEVHNNLAVALQLSESVDRAMDHIETALWLSPRFATAHLNRSVAWLRKGDFRRGWPEFEWRRHCENHRLPGFSKPRWTGEPLPEGTILLHAEQGLGDTFQFIRYASVVKQRVGKVIVQCQKPLADVLARCPDIDRLVARGQKVPEHDVQISLMSLPAIFETTLADVPASVPYVFADDDLVETWRTRLGEHPGFRIGIAWQGSKQYATDAFRSLAVRHFAPLAEVAGVRLFSLQKETGSEQLADWPGPVAPIDFGPELDTTSGPFMDTAAIMQNLDLIITSDTAVVHLAGAMGRPVWAALGTCADWRWLESGEDCPWYPTMRLFRQSRLGDWDELFGRIAAELKAVVDGDTARLQPLSRVVAAPIEIPVSPGELLDKMTILQIKSERMADEAKRSNVRRELRQLTAVHEQTVRSSAELTSLSDELKAINESLWETEDAIRRHEAESDFGPKFIELARAVYRTNDRRSEVKRKINLLLGSSLLEEKQYAEQG